MDAWSRTECRTMSRTMTVNDAPPPPAVEWEVADDLVPYEAAVARMEARVAAIQAGEAGELVRLVEHPPPYTAATSASDEELLVPGRLPVDRAGRGGRPTYHGPGHRAAIRRAHV